MKFTLLLTKELTGQSMILSMEEAEAMHGNELALMLNGRTNTGIYAERLQD